jgi:hypothetical protein
MSGRSPTELADAYLDSLNSQADEEKYEEALGRRDALQERLSRFEQSYGESDPVTKELREKVQSAEARVASIRQDREEPKERARELLEAAKTFSLDDEWLTPNVIAALNFVLTGERRRTLRAEDVEINAPVGDDEVGEVARYDVIDSVRRIVLDKLGESDDLEQVWRSIEDSSKEAAFLLVAERGSAEPDDVVQALEEDVSRSAARNRLKNAVYDSPVSPYHRVSGTYHLSTAGRYIASEYAGQPAAPGDEDGDEVDSAPDDPGQMRLDDGHVAADGGGAGE